MSSLAWQKNKAFARNPSAQSPRQVANKAYSLARKKLDRDEQRRRPQYDVRERLLLYTTMCKAETVLDKSPSTRRPVKIADDDDVMGFNQPYQPMAKPPVLDLPSVAPVTTTSKQNIESDTQSVASSLPQDQCITQINRTPVSVISRDCRVIVHHGASSSLTSSSILA